jgi:hypothetical protein
MTKPSLLISFEHQTKNHLPAFFIKYDVMLPVFDGTSFTKIKLLSSKADGSHLGMD